MSLQILEPKTAPQLLARMTEIERIAIRRASLDRLEYLRQTSFMSDGPPSIETMIEVKNALDAHFTESSKALAWGGQTWNF